MSVNVRLPTEGAARVNRAVNRLAGWLAGHWLAVFNTGVAIFLGLPFLAPILASAGLPGPARVIYTVYAPACHQLPERSFFLFGPQLVYTVADLEALGALPPDSHILERQALRWNGSSEVGYKIAICQRDISIYGSILVSGLLFGLLRPWLRRRGRLPKLPLWAFGLLLLPIALDGATQLAGLRESSWQLRLLSGGLMGAATVWLAYPHVQEAMDEVLTTAPAMHAAESTDPETGQDAGLEV